MFYLDGSGLRHRACRTRSLRPITRPLGHSRVGVCVRRKAVAAPIASSLPRRQPVVTARGMHQPTRTYRRLAQVTSASDGLPNPSSTWAAQYGPPHTRSPRAPSTPIAPTRRSPSPGSMARLDVSTSRRKRHRRQCRVPRRQAAKKRHKTGVVSRAPRGSRGAQASGTGRNTDRTGSTHQRQHQGQAQRGSKGQPD